MAYKITKNDKIIASFGRVNVLYGGALECRQGFGERVELILAPGQWDNVFWEPHEE